MRALLSVWDKAGIVDFARSLHQSGVELISTGGTKATLDAAGIPATAVSDVTEFPEILDGRVKTLHPRIHGGLLARRDIPEHMAEIAAHQIAPIDIVVANLYPFSQVVANPESTLVDALENIDIGGPSMIRSAAKNFPSVLVIVDPADYDQIAEQIVHHGLFGIPQKQRRALAAKAFAHVSAYDAVITAYLNVQEKFPAELTIAAEKMGELRYGENPHQSAALYFQRTPAGAHGVAMWQLLSGKAMSYLNYLDADAAVLAADSFSSPTIVIVKHASPCGIATAPALQDAYEMALASDPVSAYGGILAANREIDGDTALRIAKHYFEVVVAPGFSDQARARLSSRKNLRLIVAPADSTRPTTALRQLNGAFLLQDVDTGASDEASWTVATNRSPTIDERTSLEFAWACVGAVTSNAIVLAAGSATVGIGGGQPNRVDAVRIAIARAGDRVAGSSLASDAYFPFADNIEVAARAGVSAIIQPGGSIRDNEVIDAANRAGMAMVFTGTRHFRH